MIKRIRKFGRWAGGHQPHNDQISSISIAICGSPMRMNPLEPGLVRDNDLIDIAARRDLADN
jgi:hypothetical protein